MRNFLLYLSLTLSSFWSLGQTYFNILSDYNGFEEQVFCLGKLNDSLVQINTSALNPSNNEHYYIYRTYNVQTGNLNSSYNLGYGDSIVFQSLSNSAVSSNNSEISFSLLSPYANSTSVPTIGKLIKHNLSDTIWMKDVSGGGDTVTNFTQLKLVEGNKLLLGGLQTTLNGASSAQFYLSCTDTNGTRLWHNWYGGSGQDRLLSIDTTGIGGYVLSGFTTSPEYNASPQNSNVMVVFVDSVGNTIITRSLGGPTGESCAIRTLSDTSYLIYGLQENSSGDNQIFIAKLNYLGSIIWEKTFAFGPHNNSIHDLEVVDDGFVFCGYSSDSDNDPNGLIMKTDFDGNLKWFRKYKPRNNDNYLRDLQLMPDGGFLLAGFAYSDTTTNTSDAWIMRTNCLGFDGPPEANASFQSLQAYNLMIEDLSERYGTLYVDFGDGVQDTFPEQVSPLFINHTYPQDDVYTIQIIAEACNGESDTLYHDFHATSTLGTTEFEKDINVKVYPNPSKGLFTLEYELRSPNATIEVYHLNGKLMYTSSLKGISGQHNFDLSTLSKGVYLLKVNAIEASSTQRIIKQ